MVTAVVNINPVLGIRIGKLRAGICLTRTGVAAIYNKLLGSS